MSDFDNVFYSLDEVWHKAYCYIDGSSVVCYNHHKCCWEKKCFEYNVKIARESNIVCRSVSKE